jgi:hypothetical protein
MSRLVNKISLFSLNIMKFCLFTWNLDSNLIEMIAVAARLKGEDLPPTSLLGLRVRIPHGAWMSDFCDYCVLSDRGLCDGPITRPEESCLTVCVCLSVTMDARQWMSPRPLGAVSSW